MKRNFALITLAFFLGVVPLGLIAAEKPNLVLLPIEVSESEQTLEDEYGSAIQKGLSLSYNVYYGSEVERELEKEYSKLDCTTESCNQNVAIAFNGELIADAAVTKFPDGYLLKLTISNVLTNRVVFSNTLPCEGCSIYSVIPILETLGVDQRTSSNAPQIVNTQSTLRRAILLLDSQPTGAIITINDEQKGRTPYQGLDYKVGDIVVVRLDSEGYIPYEDRIILTNPITQFEPITLAKALGDVIVTVDPFIPATTILIDNEEVGIAPLNTKVQTGTHKFVARNGSDFTDVVTTSIELNNNEPVTLKFNRNSNDSVARDFYESYGEPSERFDTTISGLVTDRKTDLVWKRCSEGQNFKGNNCSKSAKKYSYYNALKLEDSRWRLPTSDELMTLVICKSTNFKQTPKGNGCPNGVQTPVIEMSVFPNSANGEYWTSSSLSILENSFNGNIVDFRDGWLGNDTRNTENFVRLIKR